MKSIHVVRIYPHPIGRVWEAVATSRGLAAWLMPNDFEPRVGCRFQLRWKKVVGWRGWVDCEVLRLEPPHHLAFSWQGDSKHRKTEVSFRLEPVPEGTRLEFEHSGFQGIGGLLSRWMMTNGWRRKLLDRQLNAALSTMAQHGAARLVPIVP